MADDVHVDVVVKDTPSVEAGAMGCCCGYKVGTMLLAIWHGIGVVFRLLGLWLRHCCRCRYVCGLTRHPRPPCLDDPKYGQHDYMEVNGVTLHYVASGPKDAPLMLMLHGFPEFWFSWRHQLPEFSRDYRCVALDMRGYNSSSKPQGRDSYKISMLMADIEAAVTHLGYTSCTLVCHDWGGVLGWAMGHRYPKMIDRLIVLNAPPGALFQKLLRESSKQRAKSWYMFLMALPAVPEAMIRACDFGFVDRLYGRLSAAPVSIASKASEEGITEEEFEAYKYSLSQPGALTAMVNWYRALLSTNRQASQDPYSMPVLLLWGMQDVAFINEVADMAEEKYKGPNFTVHRLEKAGHFAQCDTPTEVNAVIQQWLSANPLPNSNQPNTTNLYPDLSSPISPASPTSPASPLLSSDEVTVAIET